VVSIYGQVEKIDCGSASEFKPGDEVCGMTDVARGSTWAEYVLAETREVAIKPKWLGWAEAVAVPMSALTAWQASGLPQSNFQEAATTMTSYGARKSARRRVLITGAAGGIGIYLVQLAALIELPVTAATSSNARNELFLRSLGADETVEYLNLEIGTAG